MKLFPLIAAVVLSLREGTVSGFSLPTSSRSSSTKTKLHATVANNHQDQPSNENRTAMRRRALLSNLLASSSALLLVPAIADAAAPIPSLTSSEFDVILKESAKSVFSVELSGPKSETAVVKLVDGTNFAISDLVESSTDPRSPLKLVARCRLYNIPVKNSGLLSMVSGDSSIISKSGRKTKNYMNPRVQEAEVKEKAKRARMAEDERERLAELYAMEGKEESFLSEGKQ